MVEWARSPNPPPTLMGGGELRAVRVSQGCRLHHEIVPLSVQREVVAALVRAGALLAELHETVIQERRGAEPVQIRREPLRAERLVHEYEMLHRLLRLPDSAGRLEADAAARLLVHVADGLQHAQRDRQRRRWRDLPRRRLDEVGP